MHMVGNALGGEDGGGGGLFAVLRSVPPDDDNNGGGSCADLWSGHSFVGATIIIVVTCVIFLPEQPANAKAGRAYWNFLAPSRRFGRL
jgi:hypothetical protein